MRRTKQLLKKVGMTLVGLAVVFGGMEQARAVTTIDFEALSTPNDQSYGGHYEEDGFALDALPPNSGGFATFGTNSPKFPGSPALFNSTINGVTQLTALDSSPFDLVSINLAEFVKTLKSPVTFTGTLSGGGTVTQTVTLDGNEYAQETFSFSDFDNVVAVQWTQQSPYHQFDNIVVNQPTPTPEPGTMLLLGTGLLGLAGYGWRRKQRQAV